ncbi:MAG: hypothetical protein ACF8K1_11370 [Phycisphaerales bacterium JB047]
MQSNILEPSSLPPLPEPGPFEHWVLEQPILPAAVLLLVALTTLFALRHSKHFKRIGIPAALLAILCGIGIYLLGSLTITDREQLRQSSRNLVQSVAESDRTTLRAMLDDDAQLSSVFASAQGADRIVTLATTRNTGVVRSADVGEVNAGIFGPQVATTQIRVRTQGDMFPTLSWWRVDWTRPSETSDDWVVTHIEPIWVQGYANPGPDS